jgi:hypothetical protein
MLKKISLPDLLDRLFIFTIIVTLTAGILSNVFNDYETIAKVLWVTIAGTVISALFSLYFSITENDRTYFVIALLFLAGTVVNLIAMTKL